MVVKRIDGMIVFNKASVMNMENAIRGARNPLSSWERSDSRYGDDGAYILGENDLKLAARLARAGSDHRKYLRQIFVSVDITAPLYWWKEYDTYKVGTVANSTSTMHKLHGREITTDDFSCEKMSEGSLVRFAEYVGYMGTVRKKYVRGKDKADWYDLIQLLPSSYNQTRTCTMNYENLISMFYARRDHKLEEWHAFCDWIRTLPYSGQLIQVYEEMP